MKRLYPIWGVTLLVAFISLHATFVFAGNGGNRDGMEMPVDAGSMGNGTHDKDTIHTWEYIENISITEPQRALQVIDEAEELGLIPQYHLDHLRSIVYQNGLNMYRYALTYSLKVYRSDSIRRHPDEALQVLELITDQYNNTGNYTESIRYAIEGIELARQTGDKASEANLLLYIAINKRHMGLKKEAEPYFKQSVELLEEVAHGSSNWEVVDDLIYLYGTIGTFALDDKEYQKAIDLLPRYHKLMEQFKSCTDLPDGIYDMRLASIYALYTSVFAADGQMDKAEEYYRKFDATEYAHTDDGNQMRFDYLLAAGRYREVLQFIHADKENYRAQGDTVNHYYVGRTLTSEAEAYMGLDDYKAAARTYKQMYDLADSLHVREKQNGVLEFAAIYETKEKEAQLVEQTARLHESRMIALFTGCLVVLFGVLLWRTVRHVHIIRQKNVVMARTIREQLAYKDELFLREEEVRTLQEELRQKTEELSRSEERPEEVPTEAATEASVAAEEEIMTAGNPPAEEYTEAMMRGMFDRAKYEIISRKLYLCPDFSREKLMEVTHIPWNKFAGLFKKYTGMSFSRYINKLRLEYATRLMEEHPEYSIEAIAEECGISSSTTFYRLFFEEYKMTPKNFRDSLKHSDN
ncbi:AraC family transcriptional regulator [Parabacteroides pacaensis]|uniref:AraC family transcriptional regulator n=1 Tax=Parabacteroides pacaensis TaxID=2086575 RepID=UPI000D0EB44A|nr:AraC family transcriptional regulator [Parabacteroides pacaensis]